ncbi:hypothetical protein NKI09_31170 [Mesorhizobium sp. M0757]|nr:MULTISPECIES: hypothetical protein [unclassified Mesorhizobium]ESX29152.1 hypothetical protein X764_32105 [Mesorhizobium sp. LSHC440A00]
MLLTGFDPPGLRMGNSDENAVEQILVAEELAKQGTSASTQKRPALLR